MFIQDVHDDITKHWRPIWANTIGLLATIGVILVCLILLPVVPVLWLLIKFSELKWIDWIGNRIKRIWSIIFYDVKICKKCGKWEDLDMWGTRTCDCKRG